MPKKYGVMAMVASMSFLTLAMTVWGERLLTKEEALKNVFGDCEVTTETKNLSPEVISKIKERLGGSLYYVPKDSANQLSEKKLDFYFATNNGQKIGVAIIDKQPGKWGMMEFIIAMDMKGTVKEVKVMSHVEKAGQSVTRSNFLSQFEGKTYRDQWQINKDINGISGATITTNGAIFAVKKATVVFDELYLK